MRVYIGHATSFDYEKELYDVIRNNFKLKDIDLILPHEKNYVGNSSRDFYDNIDLFIGEVSYKSTGLGIEIGWAYDSNIPIYFIYKKNFNVSKALNIVSDKFYSYDSNEELVDVIKNIILKEER